MCFPANLRLCGGPRRWLHRLAWTVVVLAFVATWPAASSTMRGQQIVSQFQAGSKRLIVEAALPQLAIIPPKQLPELKGSTTFF